MRATAFIVLCLCGLPKSGPAQSPSAAPIPESTTPSPPDATTQGSLRVAGISVVRDTLDAKFARYRPFSQDPGTRISLIYSDPGAHLIAFDCLKSSLVAFTDNLGTNLLAHTNRLQSSGFIDHQSGVSVDGSRGYFEIFGTQTPSQGALRCTVSGSAVFLTASRMETLQSPVTPTGSGQRVSVGEKFQFTTTRWEKGGIGNAGTTLSLACAADPRIFIAFRFLAPDGSALESRSVGQINEMGSPERPSVLHFHLADAPTQWILETTYWSDASSVIVPFTLSTSLGE